MLSWPSESILQAFGMAFRVPSRLEFVEAGSRAEGTLSSGPWNYNRNVPFQLKHINDS